MKNKPISFFTFPKKGGGGVEGVTQHYTEVLFLFQAELHNELMLCTIVHPGEEIGVTS